MSEINKKKILGTITVGISTQGSELFLQKKKLTSLMNLLVRLCHNNAMREILQIKGAQTIEKLKEHIHIKTICTIEELPGSLALKSTICLV